MSDRAPFVVAGLFAGVGGIELGLRRAGHEAALLCEFDPGASAVLEQRFPGVRLHGDVRTLPALPRKVDLLAAGFPCQDLSQAGQTKGIAGARSGLVREVFRLLEARPVPWLLLENVPFMLQLARGEALDVIITELERLGYRWAYRVVNSEAFGLPQRRQRVFLVASLEADPRGVLFADEAGPPAPERARRKRACGFYWTEGIRGLGWAEDGVPTLKGGSTIGIPSPPAIVLPSGEIVKPDIRDAERLQGFEADWTLPATAVVKRGHRWKLVGNAVTVDVAHWIGERLRSPGNVVVGAGQRVRPGRSWPKAAWNVGDGRHEVDASEWPIARPRTELLRFLQFQPEPLSAKATAGFLERTQRSSLRFPDGFIDTVRGHLARMQRAPAS
ncbi:MAG TPA: DNA (cytosine-5-)-methyltransferase [Polyangiaceae bacterium]|nr:DNA (cytosine-5-)-methyltransferase [Polyangiaceae bacterium]